MAQRLRSKKSRKKERERERERERKRKRKRERETLTLTLNDLLLGLHPSQWIIHYFTEFELLTIKHISNQHLYIST